MESGYIVFEAFHVFAQTNICLFILFNILVQFMHVNGNKWSIPFTAVSICSQAELFCQGIWVKSFTEFWRWGNSMLDGK